MTKTLKDIPWYEWLYAITEDGRIFSKKNSKFLKPRNIQGYYYTTLCIGWLCKQFRIHRLVALTYIENTDKKPEVNHKNWLRADNRVENLEWCTRSENQIHAYSNWLQKTTDKQRNWASKLWKMKWLPILQIDKLNNIVAKHTSISSASRLTSIGRKSISNCLCGLSKSAWRFQWNYLNNI